MSASPLKPVVAVAQIAIAMALVTILVMEYIRPFATEYYFREEYMRLAADCDQAMHDEVALRSGAGSAARDPALSISGDVALAVCHDYDKLRKRLLAYGVTEERLALLGVEALENERVPLPRMVAPHRMERF